ncbi:helix-turn-helix transcriptional regulator [Bacillus cereus group sp. MYBK227-1]|uniref:helix-turn-helix transcriptional regulator n=1 Tax=Bacillus cereus group sp. MYBK227-1 TaxID=3450654 RepID=UPI003F7A6E3A
MKFNPTELKRLRLEREMSQEVLGKQVGCTRSAISLIESGKCAPSRETLICFAEIFSVPIDHFFMISRT